MGREGREGVLFDAEMPQEIEAMSPLGLILIIILVIFLVGGFPLVAAAIRKLPVRSCLIDGEAIVCDANGLAVFDLLHAGAVMT